MTLTGYLLSRHTGFADSGDDWVLTVMAAGLLIVGLWAIADGIGLFYSIEGLFLPFLVLLSLGIVAAGGALPVCQRDHRRGRGRRPDLSRPSPA